MTDSCNWEYTDDDGQKCSVELVEDISYVNWHNGNRKEPMFIDEASYMLIHDLVKQLNAQKAEIEKLKDLDLESLLIRHDRKVEIYEQKVEIKQLKKDDVDLKERCFGVGGFLAMQNANVGEVSRLTGTIEQLERYRLDNGHMQARIETIRKWCESKDTVTTAPLLELINAPIKVEVITNG